MIVPHVNTKAEAEMVVAASKFKNEEFPMGRCGPNRPQLRLEKERFEASDNSASRKVASRRWL